MKIRQIAIHSAYVDDWDWEKVIPNGQRGCRLPSKKNGWKITRDFTIEPAAEARYDIESVFQNKLPSFTQKS